MKNFILKLVVIAEVAIMISFVIIALKEIKN